MNWHFWKGVIEGVTVGYVSVIAYMVVRNNVCEYLETLKANHEALAIDLVVVALWIVVGVLAYRSFKNGK